MDQQSESMNIRRTSQGKNGMVREAGELMKLAREKNKTKNKTQHQDIGWGGNAKDKEDR